MNETLERCWVSLRNSDRMRQFMKWGCGRALFRSQAYRRIDTARRYVSTYHAVHRQPSVFGELSTFCMLIGHAKSGGTLIGSLLDAHPNIIFADEADVLRFISAGFSRDQIYHILLKGSRREAIKGRVTARRLGPYSFEVPNQWQGRFSRLHVIGDSRAGPSTRRLGEDPGLLDRLHDVMNGVSVRLLHVVRNPYDPISAMMVRGKRTFENAIQHYFDYCRTLKRIRAKLNDSSLLTVRYDEVVHQPRDRLRAICGFLGKDVSDDYLGACCGILHESPEKCRQLVPWDQRWIEVVRREIDQVDFLTGYSFENELD